MSDIQTEWIQIPVRAGSEQSLMPAYLARTAGTQPKPAVLLGFEMFGITGYLRETAAQVANQGYIAVVPDFYHWQTPGPEPIELAADEGGRTRGYELINGLRRPLVAADVEATLGYLSTRADYEGQAAMVGLSAGGHIAFYAATQIPLTALAVFYPGWLTSTEVGLSRPEPVIAETERLARLGTPVLLLAGADDFLYGPGELDTIEAQLKRHGVPSEVVVYPDTPHGFACFERETYRPKAAADGWERAFTLLAKSFASRTNPDVQ